MTSSNAGDKPSNSIEDILFDCIVMVGGREGGTVIDLDTLIIDRQKAVDALALYTAQQVREALEKVLEQAEWIDVRYDPNDSNSANRTMKAVSTDVIHQAIANQGVLPNSNEGGEK